MAPKKIDYAAIYSEQREELASNPLSQHVYGDYKDASTPRTKMNYDPSKHVHVDPGNPRLKAAFRMWDKDSSGFIEPKELRAMFRQLNLWDGEEELQEKIRQFDRNRDGKIDYGEFCMLFESVTKRDSPLFKEYNAQELADMKVPDDLSISKIATNGKAVDYKKMMMDQRQELASNPLSQHVYGDYKR